MTYHYSLLNESTTRRYEMDLVMRKSTLTKGYSSHGFTAPFHEIVTLERDARENYPFTEFKDEAIMKYAECPAIWLTREPFQAFRYAISADEWDQSVKTIKERYPNWRNDIVEYDCHGWYEIVESDDGDGGVLLIFID